MERREARRFRLSVPVIFRWSDQTGSQREHIGRTRDISRVGVFVLSDILPPVGAELSLEIALPPMEGERAQRLQLKGDGKVTRAEMTSRESGFAASGPFLLDET